MDKISVKMSDVSLRQTEGAKPAGQTREVTGDFKKLLQNQSENSSKDVSKETNTEKQPEAVNEQTKEEPKEVNGAKEETEEVVTEENVQTNGLLAAFQLAQNFKPEMIQAEPETVPVEAMPVEEMVPEETAQPVISELEGMIEAPVQAAEVQMGENLQVQQMQPEKSVVEDVKPQAEQTVQEVQISEKPQTLNQQKTDTSNQESMAQHEDSHPAEQTVQIQNPEPSVKVEVQEMKPQEPVRIQVPQPEELPEKVTDQLMAKISEGIKEFEIHIEPVNLGKIAVKILYQAGQTTVSIMCSEKRTLDILGRNAGEIGQIIDKNLGGTTTIVVDKQESDYLNQTRDENQQNGRNGEQEQQEGRKKEEGVDDAQDFLQKLRLGLAG
ncbi:MAG: flagellar hook-length control protein FliK [Dorea sp.]|jgi:flagellar hook-length control protein FliK|nr:flagellar hook-length control protein FliK [Dorea sp.]